VEEISVNDIKMVSSEIIEKIKISIKEVWSSEGKYGLKALSIFNTENQLIQKDFKI